MLFYLKKAGKKTESVGLGIYILLTGGLFFSLCSANAVLRFLSHSWKRKSLLNILFELRCKLSSKFPFEKPFYRMLQHDNKISTKES